MSQRSDRSLMVFFAMVYVAEGFGQVGGLIFQPLTFYLKTALMWDADRVTEFFAIFTIPWVIKIVYGKLSDSIPLFGYRRKTWLCFFNGLAVIGYFLAFRVIEPAQISILLFLTAIAMAASSTISGAVMVENGKATGLIGKFVGQQWLWFSIAGVLTSFLGGWLCENLLPTSAFHIAALITAFTPVGVMVAAWFLINEQRVVPCSANMSSLLSSMMHAFNGDRTWNLVWVGLGAAATTVSLCCFRGLAIWVVATWVLLWALFSLKSSTLWLVAGFIAFWNLSPGFGTPLYYHMVDNLNFSQMFIGQLGMWSALGYAAGALLYMYGLRALLSLRWLIFLSVIIGTLANLGYLFLGTPLSGIILSFCNAIVGMVALLTSLTLAGNACVDGAEGLSYAALMSVSNLAGQGSNISGAWLYVHVFNNKIDPLIWVSAAFTLLCLGFIPFLPKKSLHMFSEPEMPGTIESVT